MIFGDGTEVLEEKELKMSLEAKCLVCEMDYIKESTLSTIVENP